MNLYFDCFLITLYMLLCSRFCYRFRQTIIVEYLYLSPVHLLLLYLHRPFKMKGRNLYPIRINPYGLHPTGLSLSGFHGFSNGIGNQWSVFTGKWNTARCFFGKGGLVIGHEHGDFLTTFLDLVHHQGTCAQFGGHPLYRPKHGFERILIHPFVLYRGDGLLLIDIFKTNPAPPGRREL